MNSRRPPSLSLCMIVKNEEQFLPGCLESVRTIVDEMVIVDTGSTDRTKEIARLHGAQVFDFVWTGDFSTARNESLRRATGAWVLYLDADERLMGGQDSIIHQLLNTSDARAYSVCVRNPVSLPTGTVVQLMRYARLFKREEGVQFEGSIHEQIEPSLLRTGGGLRESSLVIDHLGYNQGPEILREKAERNLKSLLARLADAPDDWQAMYYVGTTLFTLQDYAGGETYFAGVLHHSGIPKHVRAFVHCALAEAAMHANRLESAIEHCLNSLMLAPDQTAARWMLAGAYLRAGNVRDAIPPLEELNRAAEAGPISALVSLPTDVFLPHVSILDLLGKCFRTAGRLKEAAAVFLRAVSLCPDSENLISETVALLDAIAEPEYAVMQMHTLVRMCPGNVRVLATLGLWHARSGDMNKAHLTIAQAMSTDPSQPFPHECEARVCLEEANLHGARQAMALCSSRGGDIRALALLALDCAIRMTEFSEAFHVLDLLAGVLPHEKLQSIRARLELLTSGAHENLSPLP